MRHTHIHAVQPHAGSVLPIKSLFEVDKKMLPFPNAQQPQGADDDEDTEDEQITLAERLRLDRYATDAYDTFKRHCEGRNAAINDLSVWARVGEGNNLNRVDAFLGGRHVQDKPPGVLGSKMMSLALQLSKPFPMADPHRVPEFSKLSPATASYPKGWKRKYLTIGAIETEGKQSLVQDSLEDDAFLRDMLLLNMFLNTAFWQNIEKNGLHNLRFDVNHIDKETETERVFERNREVAMSLFDVLKPAVEVDINSHDVRGGRTDISVRVEGKNQQGMWQTEYTAIIELKKPSCAYRAANILAFGGELTSTDEIALRQPIHPSRVESLAAALHELQTANGSLLKHTVTRENENDKPKRGYKRNGQDVDLKTSLLKSPLDSLHFGLEQGLRYGASNQCPDTAVCDAFTFIGTHLRELREVNNDLLEANFDSHYALDMTESGSADNILIYFVNAVRRSKRARRYVKRLKRIAARYFGKFRMTEERRKRYEAESQKESEDFRCNSIPGTSLQESGRLFTNHLGPLVRNALANFRRDYGAVAESGEYEASNFDILDYFRPAKDEFDDLSTDESPVPGRSRFVAKANFYPHGRVIANNQSTNTISDYFKVCVLKVYDAEEASIERMERELKAYFRVSKLAAADQRSVSKLLAFGAIDLDDVPQMFIALEYIEDLPAGVPTEKDGVPTEETQELELNKVCGILDSVGIHHNDLFRRNFKWQIENGRWFIKVFDFDHATFYDDPHNFSVNRISQLAADDTSLEKASFGWSGAAVVLETRMC